MLVRLADLNIRIENQYAYTESLCHSYRLTDGTPDFTVRVTPEDLLAEYDGDEVAPGYTESLAIYRKIAEQILDYDGFLLHGVVMETQGVGVAFLARSGVGKSPHAALWKPLLGDKITYINGDKPLVRFLDGIPYAYGTPWAGKEGLETNARTPIKKVCFLARGEQNSVTPVPKEDVLLSLLPQVYRPKNGRKLPVLMDLLAAWIEAAAFYAVQCTPHPEAAAVCYQALFQKSE